MRKESLGVENSFCDCRLRIDRVRNTSAAGFRELRRNDSDIVGFALDFAALVLSTASRDQRCGNARCITPPPAAPPGNLCGPSGVSQLEAAPPKAPAETLTK